MLNYIPRTFSSVWHTALSTTSCPDCTTGTFYNLVELCESLPDFFIFIFSNLHHGGTRMWLCRSHCEFGVWGAWLHTDGETRSEVCLVSCTLFPSCFLMPFIAREISPTSPFLTCHLIASGALSSWCFSLASPMQPSSFLRQQSPLHNVHGQQCCPALV